MSRVTVTIDRMMLHGMNAAERLALIDAIRSELTRVLADPATGITAAKSRHTPVMRLGPITMESGAAGARRLGTRIARGIGKGVRS
jgi:hypothetical protein